VVVGKKLVPNAPHLVVGGHVLVVRDTSDRADRAQDVVDTAPSQRGVLTNTARIWGVVVDDGLVFASDMNSGLWILRRT
jgi:hypothetical protein